MTKESFIFGGKITKKMYLTPHWKSEVCVWVNIIDPIKGKKPLNDPCIRFMYDDCRGIESYDTTDAKYIICMVHPSSNDTILENLALFSFKVFDSHDKYEMWIKYYQDAYEWIGCKTNKKNQLKNAWIIEYLSDSVFINEILFEIDLNTKEYGPFSEEIQSIIKRNIIADWKYGLSGFLTLKGKNRQDVILHFLNKLGDDYKVNIGIMETMAFYIDHWKLSDIFYKYTDDSDSLHNNKALIDEFKKVALKS